MTSRAIACAILASACLACTGQGPQSEDENGPLGTLSLNLTGSDRHGQQYRLREAEFDVAPYSYYYPYEPPPQPSNVITLSTETEPEATTLQTQLLPGTYTVTLSNRLWYLEKLTADGIERVEQAVLLSPATVYAYVYDRSTTDVIFTFGVDGELIDFRHGKLRIGIGIETRDEDGGLPPGPTEDAGR